MLANGTDFLNPIVLSEQWETKQLLLNVILSYLKFNSIFATRAFNRFGKSEQYVSANDRMHFKLSL